MHAANTTLGQRQRTLREAIRVQRRHFGYVHFPAVYAWCCNLIDRCVGRCPVTLSRLAGAWFNRLHLVQYVGEWASVMCNRAGMWWNDTWMAGLTGFRFRNCVPFNAGQPPLRGHVPGAGSASQLGGADCRADGHWQ